MTGEAKCRRCGDDHDVVACPYIKAVEFDFTGLIVTRLEFLTPADYGTKSGAVDEPPREDYPKIGNQAVKYGAENT